MSATNWPRWKTTTSPRSPHDSTMALWGHFRPRGSPTTCPTGWPSVLHHGPHVSGPTVGGNGPRGQQALDDLTVQVVGHHDTDSVDVGRVGDGPPVVLGAGIAVALGGVLGHRGVGVG